jgi:adenylate kinase
MIVVFAGPPGCGKGTQASWLSREMRISHVSTGDILRAAASGGTLDPELARMLNEGALVPDSVVVRIVAERLAEPDAADGAILDGFPRTVAQARLLDSMLAAGGRSVDLVVSFYAGEATILGRLLARGREQGRGDDTADAIARRYDEFRRHTLPVVAHYVMRATRVADVDGERSVDAVHTRVRMHVAAAAATLGNTELTGRVIPFPSAVRGMREGGGVSA